MRGDQGLGILVTRHGDQSIHDSSQIVGRETILGLLKSNNREHRGAQLVRVEGIVVTGKDCTPD